MRTARDILQPTLCVNSILLLWLIGRIGECALNMPCFDGIRGSKYIPGLTYTVLSGFPVNGDYFLLSLTPFMLLMGGIAVASFDCRVSDLYWFLFCAVWLLALSYVLMFAWALLLPFF